MKVNNLKVLTAATLAVTTSLTGVLITLHLKKDSPYNDNVVDFNNSSYSEKFDSIESRYESTILFNIEDIVDDDINNENITEISSTSEKNIQDETTTTKFNKVEKPQITEATGITTTQTTTANNNNLTLQDDMNDKEYTMLKQQLIDLIQKKGFDEQTSKILHLILQKLYSSYDSMYDVYSFKGIKSKIEYISDFFNIIDKNIEKIIVFNPNKEENKELKEKLAGASGRAMIYENLVLVDENADEEELTRVVLHEIIHFGQLQASKSRYQAGFTEIFTEGEAKYSEVFLTNYFYNKLPLKIRDTSNKIEYLIYGNAGPSAYALYTKVYNMFLYLVDQESLEKTQNSLNKNYLINSINERYEINAEELVNSCIGIVSNFNASAFDAKNQKMFECLKIAEILYLECVKQDVLRATSKEEVLNIMNVYRYYKSECSVECYSNNANITNQVFNYLEIENLLKQKLKEHNVFPNEISEQVFNVLMYNTNGDNTEASITNYLINQNDEGFYLISKNSKKAINYNVNTSQATIVPATSEIILNSNELFYKSKTY